VFLVDIASINVAAASGNPIVASLVEMVSALYYERRRETAARASDRDLRDAAEMHRRIYQAIRAKNADAARLAMQAHLLRVLDAGEYQRLGDERVRRSDFRLIAASNRPLSVLKPDVLARLPLRIHVTDHARRGYWHERHWPRDRARAGGRRRRRRGDRTTGGPGGRGGAGDRDRGRRTVAMP
jgi:hypothetical protein